MLKDFVLASVANKTVRDRLTEASRRVFRWTATPAPPRKLASFHQILASGGQSSTWLAI